MQIKRHATKLKEGAFSNIIEDKPEIRAAATMQVKQEISKNNQMDSS